MNKIDNNQNLFNFLSEINFDENGVANQAFLDLAKKIGEEQRFPYLIHSEIKVSNARAETENLLDNFFEKFSERLNNLQLQDRIELEILFGTLKLKKFPLQMQIVVATLAAVCAADVIARNRKWIYALYQPVDESLQIYWQLDRDNRDASRKECFRMGYIPELVFHPHPPSHVGPEEAAFIDKNNPQNNLIIVPWS